MNSSHGTARSRPVTNPKLAVVYLRVSTEDQNLGPEAQRAAVLRWCESNDTQAVLVVEDHGVSGAAPLDRRPALLEAMDAIKRHGAGILLVAKRDRLGRDPLVVAMIEAAVARGGARVVSAAGEGTDGDDPTSVLMRRIVDAFAEYERLLIRARTKAALAVKKARGERIGGFGGVRFGFTASEGHTQLVANPAELAVVEKVKELRAAGLSLRAIADRLNVDGVTARGQRWHATTVTRLLSREAR
jgi:DNA invertase Pin-like site-specific DNA recombinase